MTTDIKTERYLNSLPEGILKLDISDKGIQSLPDLTRFKNLKQLNCSRNKLTELPTLPPNLTELYCYCNQLSSLPTLPENLEVLACNNNKLTLLPTLPPNLKYLSCFINLLTSLPNLPPNLTLLSCYKNNLTSLPNLPPNLKIFYGYYNPVYEIVMDDSYSLDQIKKNIQIVNNFRNLYYCLQFKNQLRKWLWENVREPNAKKLYNPNYLIKNLREEDDLDELIDNWGNK